jgi:hypothetical protein
VTTSSPAPLVLAREGAAGRASLWRRVAEARHASRLTGRAARVALLVGGFFGAVALHVPLCPLATLTHVPCPGCGLTRATLALYSGHFADAIALHPMAPILGPLVTVVGSVELGAYLLRGRWGVVFGMRQRWVTLIAGALWLALMMVWIARFFGAFGGPVPV